jgi:hypothetical protein
VLKSNLIAPAPAVQQGIRPERRCVGNGGKQTIMQSITDEARVPQRLAGWRVVIGELAEQLAADRLGAERLNTGMGYYCADLRHPQWGDMEVKAVGSSRSVTIYAFRLEKDREYAKAHPLSYVLVLHKVEIPQPSMLQARLLMEWAQVYVIPFSIVDAICVTVKPRVLSRKFLDRHNRRGDCERGYEKGGYTLRAKSLIEAFPHGRIQ